MKKSLAQRLRAAAEVFDEFGWIAGDYFYVVNGHPIAFCAVGALAFVAHRDRNLTANQMTTEGIPHAVEQELDKAFGRMPIAEGYDACEFAHLAIEQFNDSCFCLDHQTTKEDVQTLLLFLAEVLDSDALEAKIAADILDQIVAAKVERMFTPMREEEVVRMFTPMREEEVVS